MKITVGEIAALIGGELRGDGSKSISGAASLEQAGPEDLAFAEEKRLGEVASTRAGAVVVPRAAEGFAGSQIVVGKPHLAFSRFLGALERERADMPEGIHPTAVAHPSAVIGAGAAIGACAVIGPRARIGAGSRIGALASVGADCVIGEDALIYPNVVIRERVSIGKRVIIHPHTTIGGDGFGFLREGGRHVKLPQVGTVVIGDDVEIGCNCTIDRAALDSTVIGNGVKMDNHCHIAHNCVIGDNCLLVAYARMGGGVVLGKGVIIAADVGITDHVALGEGCIIGAGSKVFKDVPAGVRWWGAPAQELRREMRERACVSRLPELFARVKELEQKADK